MLGRSTSDALGRLEKLVACEVPGDRGSLPVDLVQHESLKLIALLQVKINILRRAQALAPQLAEEIQTAIDDIRRELRALDPDS